MVIKAENLDLMGADASVMDLCEAAAIDEMQGYMRGRYDVGRIFVPSNGSAEWLAARSPLLVRHLVAMTLYLALQRSGFDELPQLRVNAYREAQQWLMDITNGKFDPGFPPKLDPQTGEVDTSPGFFRIRGARKRRSQW
jgi:hypothetical protein